MLQYIKILFVLDFVVFVWVVIFWSGCGLTCFLCKCCVNVHVVMVPDKLFPEHTCNHQIAQIAQIDHKCVLASITVVLLVKRPNSTSRRDIVGSYGYSESEGPCLCALSVLPSSWLITAMTLSHSLLSSSSSSSRTVMSSSKSLSWV